MHVSHYHCERPHTLYYNHRHALLFLLLSLSILKKCTPKSAAWHRLWLFEYSKHRNICESPIHPEASNKISSKSDEKQRSYSNFSNRVKIAKFSEIFASRTRNFRFFSTFYSDSEISRWEESNGLCPIEIGRLVLEIWRGEPNRPPPHQLTYILQIAHQ